MYKSYLDSVHLFLQICFNCHALICQICVWHFTGNKRQRALNSRSMWVFCHKKLRYEDHMNESRADHESSETIPSKTTQSVRLKSSWSFLISVTKFATMTSKPPEVYSVTGNDAPSWRCRAKRSADPAMFFRMRSWRYPSISMAMVLNQMSVQEQQSGQPQEGKHAILRFN